MSKVFQCISTSILIFLFAQTLVASCIQGDCKNGKGTYLFKDGSKYLGSFINFKPSGSGSYFSPKGISYQGQFSNGKKHGFGKLIFAESSIYEGQFVQDVIFGKGIIKYQNGDVYDGLWANGQMNGFGVYTFSNGDIYEGNFANGAFDGKGKLIVKDGSFYDGDWVNNKKNGQGITKSNGRLYTVNFQMDKLVDSKLFQTEFVAIKHNNKELKDCNTTYCNLEKGFYIFSDGSKFEGDFVNGKPKGKGICIYKNGNKYVGDWEGQSPHGLGSLYYGNGKKLTSYWTYGKAQNQVKNQISENTETGYKKFDKVKSDDGDVDVYALVVGVASYNHQQSLKYTDDDAYQLYAFLKSPEGGALQDDRIRILIDDAATKSNIEKELSFITSRADANDVVLIYMSGHGLDGSFVPSDFDGFNHLLPYEMVLNALKSSEAKHKMLIADACHSGSMIAQAKDAKSFSTDQFYKAYSETNGGIAIMTSSKREEVSLEYGGLRQGIFSHFLIRGLKGEANLNHDKLITVSELFTYVSQNVKSYTAGIQNPTIQGKYDHQMPVAMIR